MALLRAAQLQTITNCSLLGKRVLSVKKTNNAAQLNIRYLSNDGQVLSVPLGERDLTVGSAENADIRLNTTTISRQHLRITLRDNRVYVTDLDSRNGTFLNGMRLQPNVEREWLPGDRLRLSETTLELIEQVLQQKKAPNELKLSAEPLLVKPGQIVRLTLTATGETQQVTLQSQSIVPGLAIQLNWQGGEVKADVPVEIQAQIRSTNITLTGGERRVRFVALSRSNLISTIEVTVRLRKKLETLLLLLLLLTGCSAASLAAVVVVPRIIALINPPPPTAQSEVIDNPPQVTPQLAVVPTTAPSPIPPTDVPTLVTPPSVTPTNTPITPTGVTVTPCPTGTVLTHTVQASETLFSIGQRYNTNVSALMNINNISNPNKIFSGQKLTVHCGQYDPATITTQAPPICQSVKPTSPLDGLACGSNTFYWDPAPGADQYVLNLYDEKNNKVQSITTKGDETNLTTSVDVASAGSGINFSWDVQALQKGQVICSSQPVKLLRSSCPVENPKADLVVSGIKLTAEPTWSQQCTLLTVNVSYTLTNIGKGASGAFFSNLSYQNDHNGIIDLQCGGKRGQGCHESDLQPGQSVAISDQSLLSIKDLSGSQQITVIGTADIGVPGEACPNNTYCRVDESNEGNNASRPLVFPVPNCFDLGVNILNTDVIQQCVEPHNGQFQVIYHYTITNYGTTDVGAITTTENRTLTLTLLNPPPIFTPSKSTVNQSIETLGAGQTSAPLNGSIFADAPDIGNGESNFTSLLNLIVQVQAKGIQESDTKNNTKQIDADAPGGEGSFDCTPIIVEATATPDPQPPPIG